MRGGDALQPVERLEAALRLARLARLGAEALDEARHVRDLALLLLEHRLLHGEPRGALRLERGVVAGVEREHAALEVGDVRDAAVEEVAVVRDQQQRAAVAREPALEPDHGVEVEVVGGFVEQQQVGPAHQRLRQVQAHAPAAREIGDGSFEVRRLEAEPREQRGCARPGAVAVDRFEPDVQFRKRAAIVRCVGGGDRPLDAPQFLVAVEHELDRRPAARAAFPARPMRSASRAAPRSRRPRSGARRAAARTGSTCRCRWRPRRRRASRRGSAAKRPRSGGARRAPG